MATPTMIDALSSYTTFGALLHYLRRSARLTQRELAIAVGYSESMISRLEHGERVPDAATILALFVPALHVAGQPDIVAQLVRLANEAKHKETKQEIYGGQATEPQSWQPAASPQGFPVRLTSFVGRENDILAVAKQLLRSRLGDADRARRLGQNKLGGGDVQVAGTCR